MRLLIYKMITLIKKVQIKIDKVQIKKTSFKSITTNTDTLNAIIDTRIKYDFELLLIKQTQKF